MRTLAVITLLVAVCVSAHATGWIGYRSNYVAPISGTTFHNGGVLQGCYTLVLDKNGTYVLVWVSCSPDGQNNVGDETDYALGRTAKIGKLELDGGLYYYDMLPRLNQKGDFLAMYMGLKLQTKSSWKPALWVEEDISTNRSQCPSGLIALLSVSGPVGKNTLNLSVGSHPDAFGVKAQAVSFFAAELTIPTQQKGLTYFVRGQLTTKPVSDGGMADNAFTAGITQGF